MANITNYVKFLYGTPQAYKNLQVKNADTLYFISEADSKQGTLYWGEKLIAGAVSNLQDLENVILEIGLKDKKMTDKLSEKEINVKNIQFLKEMYV